MRNDIIMGWISSGRLQTAVVVFCLLFRLSADAQAPDTWTQRQTLPASAREKAASFSINGKGYLGLGYNGVNLLFNDLWEFDPAANFWTQKADFPSALGPARCRTIHLAMNGKGYIGMGTDGVSYLSGWFEYDPGNNSWTQKATFPGGGRYSASAFSVGNFAYVGTGYDGASFNDFWSWNQTTNTWVQLADVPFPGRYSATAFSIGPYGYLGTGFETSSSTYKKDLWRFHPPSGTWTQMADLPGLARALASSFTIGNRAFITGGSATTPVAMNDLWEYSPILNQWTQRASSSQVRFAACAFSIGNKGYVGTGTDNSVFFNDFWEYTPVPLSSISFQRTYGGTGDDTDPDPASSRMSYGSRTTDGGFIIATSTTSFGDSNGDMYLIRTDAYGDTLWTKVYGNPGNNEIASSVRQTTDGGYVVAGRLGPYLNCDGIVMKVNSNGGSQWTMTLPGAGNIQRANYAEELPGGGYIVTGRFDNGTVLGAAILRLNASGGSVANRTVSRSAATPTVEGYAVERTGIGAYTVSGEFVSGGNGDAALVFSDPGISSFSLYNMNSVGNGAEERALMKENPDGTYIICSTTNASACHGGKDILVMKVNSMGNTLQWSFCYGGTGDETARAIDLTADGGYIITGFTKSTGAGGDDVVLMKLGSSGLMQWVRTYGGTADDRGNSLALLPDGGFALFGETRSFGSGGSDVYFIRTDSAGLSHCNETNASFPSPLSVSLTVTGPSATSNTASPNTLPGPNIKPGPAPVNDLCTFCTFPVTKGRTNATCFSACNGTANANPVGGLPPYTYLWNPGGFTTSAISGLCSGTYSVLITDANSCSAVDTVQIKQPTQIQTNISGPASLCPGKTLTLTSAPGGGSPPYTYNWSPAGSLSCSTCPNPSASPTTSTNYTLVVTDTKTCTATQTYSVTLLPKPTPAMTAIPVSCSGQCNGSVSAIPQSGSPPYTYSWFPNVGSTQTISNLCPNPYTVTIVDGNGCSAVGTDTVKSPLPLTSTVTPTPSSCCNGTAAVQPGGGTPPYTYAWVPGGQTTSSITGLCPGGYTVTITDSKGCNKTNAASIGGAPSFTLSAMSPLTICSGSAATLTASSSGPGTISYSWSPGGFIGNPFIASPSSPTIYTVTATDTSSGCVHTATVSVGVAPSPTATITGPATICANTSVTLTGGGTGNYIWSPGGQTTSSISGISTATGTYTFSLVVTSVANLNCSDTATHVLTVVSSPAVAVSATSTTLCAGLGSDTLIATAFPGANYSWTSSPSGGPYPNNDTIVVSPDPLGPHSYTVVVSVSSGCSGSSTVTINVSPGYPTPSLTPSTGNYCLGDSLLPISCTNAVTNVGWTDVQGNVLFIGNPFTPTVTAAGSYTFLCVQGTSNYCLSYPAAAVLTIHPLPNASAGADVSICGGHTANLNASGGIAYSWSPSTYLNSSNISNPSSTPDSSVAYQVTVVDINGCRDRDTIRITLLVNDTCGIHIYNSITPNGDGDNDVWWIDGIHLYPKNTVSVFNRWGTKVWEGNRYDNKKVVWRGQSQGGQPLPAGTYFYVIDVEGLGQFSNWVELLR